MQQVMRKALSRASTPHPELPAATSAGLPAQAHHGAAKHVTAGLIPLSHTHTFERLDALEAHVPFQNVSRLDALLEHGDKEIREEGEGGARAQRGVYSQTQRRRNTHLEKLKQLSKSADTLTFAGRSALSCTLYTQKEPFAHSKEPYMYAQKSPICPALYAVCMSCVLLPVGTSARACQYFCACVSMHLPAGGASWAQTFGVCREHWEW